MSAVAAEAGVSRATLYKYFPDVESILIAGHHRHVQAHLEELRAVIDHNDNPRQALVEVLTTYAGIQRHRAGDDVVELAGLVHGPSMAHHDAHDAIHALLATAIAAARTDAATDPSGDVVDAGTDGALATMCLHALAAATSTQIDIHEVVAFCLRGIGTAHG